jgi:cystathionine beta-lyase/cystathionine gamma-synthase
MGVICGSNLMIRKIFHSEFMTFGTIVSPHDAFLAIRGLRTLPLRVQRSDDTCKKIFEYLKQSNKIRKIHYALDPRHPKKELIDKQMRGNGGLITLELDTESKDQVSQFVTHLDKFLMAVSWGGYESLKMPTLAFYDIPGQVNPAVHFSTIRLYIGLEDPEFLIQNLENAFQKM